MAIQPPETDLEPGNAFRAPVDLASSAVLESVCVQAEQD